MSKKNVYPTFWDIYFRRVDKHQDVLTEARRRGRIEFIKKFIEVFKWDCKLSGWKKATRNHFIGFKNL